MRDNSNVVKIGKMESTVYYPAGPSTDLSADKRPVWGGGGGGSQVR